VEKRDEVLVLDFPSRQPSPCAVPDGLAAALGKAPCNVLAARDVMAVYDDERVIADMKPDFAALAQLDGFAVIVTAPGRDCDFVSRFFAPRAGIPEDPVTGSAHCTLVPYWAERLGKTDLHARQLSKRGGELFCSARGDRVSIGGHTVTYLSGAITVPGPVRGSDT
jgi:predicted PhzF superfamily epimerase YddE/YHI9